MEREILFEVLRADNKEIIGYERIGERGQWEHKRINRDEWLLGAITDGQEYYKFIRRQFIGLTDKNGVKIFEGDIYKRCYFPLGTNVKAVSHYHLCEVLFNQSSFVAKIRISCTDILDKEHSYPYSKPEREIYSHPTLGKGLYCEDIRHNERLEVIGNIYSNPELLKQENQ